MEDLADPAASGSPALQDAQEPEALDDPSDPLQPGIEEEDRPNAPLGDPTADVDAFEDEEAPETVAAMNDQEAGLDRGDRASAHDSGEDSELDELDEAQFENFDADKLNIPDVPTQVDESNVGQLGVHKRKRTAEEQEESRKKKKERKREKPRREKKRRGAEEDEPDFEGGPEIEGKRARKGKGGGGGAAPRRAKTPEDEENLTPEERRRRALDRKMDEAVKSNRPSRKRTGIDLEAQADQEIETMRHRMAKACEADSEARARGEVATQKLKILPEVVELMNRNTIQTQLVDPDTNLLEAVRFMLEPADQDAALPNYKIQRELFAILQKLTISKEALLASGIGKVIMFYTKSSQPETGIKHAAEKLFAEWMRTVLGKQKTMRHRPVAQKAFDPSQQVPGGRAVARTAEELAEEKRRKLLAAPGPANRARVDGGVGTYTVAPVSNLSGSLGVRRQGQAGEEAFRKIQARAKAGEGKK